MGDFISTFGQDLKNFNPEKNLAELQISRLVSLVDAIENAVARIGVKHQIEVYLGDYGDGGRSLILNEHDAASWGRNVGDWLSSSGTCS